MRKIFFYAAALCSMAFAASCQKEVTPEIGKGEPVNVTFTISTESIQSKAVIGEAPSWEKTLTFGAYRNGNLLSPEVYKIVDDFGTDNEATVTLTLVKGQTYDFVFWADAAEKDYYTVDLEAKNVTVDYDAENANDKLRDAWYAVEEAYKVTDDNLNKNIELKRAVAQINVGTLDYAKAVTAGVVVTKSSVTVENVGSTLNFFTGKTSNPVKVSYAANTIPMLSLEDENTLTVYNGTENEKEYEYLSLNYVLTATGADQDLVTFTVDFYEDGNDSPVNNPIRLENVPVRRNYRTNIISDNVLTDDATFTITINPIYDGEYVYTDGGSTPPVTPEEPEPTPDPTPEPEPEPEPAKLYLIPNSNWTIDNARFAAYFFGGTPNEVWVSMTLAGNNVYEVVIPEGYDYGSNIIFCRMNPGASANNWNNKWNQTADLIIPTDGKNLYTVPAGVWDGSDDDYNWSVK